MKKILAVLLAACMGMTVLAGAVTAAPSVNKRELAVLLDGRKIIFPDEQPQIDKNSRVLIPIRFVSEALGAKVEFKNKTVTIRKDKTVISLTIGSNSVTVDGKKIELDTKPIIVNDRTLVPLRFISEALKQKVEWDGPGRWVWIGEKTVPNFEEMGFTTVDAEEIKPMLGSTAGVILSVGGRTVDQATIFSYNDLPLEVGGSVIYDLWVVQDKKEVSIYLRVQGLNSGIYFLTDKKGEETRYRRIIPTKTVGHADGTQTVVYPLLSHVDTTVQGMDNSKFTIQSPVYIGLDWEETGMSSIALLKNPFRP